MSVSGDEPSPTTPTEPERNGASNAGPAQRLSMLVRVVLVFTGVVMPILCFAIGFPVGGFPGPRWQSGEPGVYAAILLTHVPSLPLYPLLIYNMTSLALVVARPARFSKNVVVRFGIYTGAVLAAEYWAVFQVAIAGNWPQTADDFAGLAWQLGLSALPVVVPWGGWWLVRFAGRKLRPEHRFGLAFVGITVAICALVILVLFEPGNVIGFFVLVCLWSATPWALASYLAVSIWLLHGWGEGRFRFSLAQLLVWVGWFAAHCSAWRTSFNLMLEHYAALPASQPKGCFVCSAAARGHARFVGSRLYVGPDGTACPVNDQLRRLKAFELLLASLSPRGHRALRRLYNRVGPRLAALLVHPLAADAAYLALKPCEWIAVACLMAATAGGMDRVNRLYRAKQEGEAASRTA